MWMETVQSLLQITIPLNMDRFIEFCLNFPIIMNNSKPHPIKVEPPLGIINIHINDMKVKKFPIKNLSLLWSGGNQLLKCKNRKIMIPIAIALGRASTGTSSRDSGLEVIICSYPHSVV